MATLSRPHASSRASTTAPALLHLTVRFLSLPDLQLTIADSHHTPVATLKQLIRRALRAAAAAAAAAEESTSSTTSPPEKTSTSTSTSTSTASPTLQDAHRRRLRIIYGGKILADDTLLGHVLRPVLPPPRAGASASATGSRSRSNSERRPGRTPPPPAVDGPSSSSSTTFLQPPLVALPNDDDAAARVYVSCSLGDVLDDRALAAEAEDAQETEEAVAEEEEEEEEELSPEAAAAAPPPPPPTTRRRPMPSHHRIPPTSSSPQPPPPQPQPSQQPPAPRGFDRLLQTGFTPAEVNQLRLQFNSIQAARYTPDTMPSPDALRALEDHWLDSSWAGQGGPGSGAGVGAAGTRRDTALFDGDTDGTAATATTATPADDDDFGPFGVLDSMVRGLLVGFLFPLGSTCWLAREDGLMTRRWRAFVGFGFTLSLFIGLIKSLVGEW